MGLRFYTKGVIEVSGPLDGVLVIEWAMFRNGPVTGSIMGDLGANVVKVEQPGVGDAQRGMGQLYGDSMQLPGGKVLIFETDNRSKRSVSINLKSKEGQTLAHRLIEKADVFITNFSDIVAERCAMNWTTLHEVNPLLIYGQATGFGSKGPEANWRAFDTLAQARSGLMYAAGDLEDNADEPVGVVGTIMDEMSATMLAFGIVTALFHRERTGLGQRVETSLFGSALHLQALNTDSTLFRRRPLSRHSRKRPPNVMGNHYCCADGKWIMFAEPQQNRFWSDFCQALGLSDLEQDDRFDSPRKRMRNRELVSILEQTIRQKTRSEWIQHFVDRGVRFAFGPVCSMDEMAEDEQAVANRYIVDWDHPVFGRIKTMGYPIDFSETPAQLQRASPELGEHTEEVLLEEGYTWHDISRLRELGAI